MRGLLCFLPSLSEGERTKEHTKSHLAELSTGAAALGLHLPTKLKGADPGFASNRTNSDEITGSKSSSGCLHLCKGHVNLAAHNSSILRDAGEDQVQTEPIQFAN